MPRKMVLITADGQRPVLTEADAVDELQLQKQLAETPDLIPVDDFDWTGPMMVVGRETRLPSGAADVVGVSRTGEVLVAELKRGPDNSDFRYALAQAQGYGADLYGMTIDQFEETVARRYFASAIHCPPGSPVKDAASLMVAAEATWGDWTDEERAAFVPRLTRNLQTGSLHFAIVAQRFTPAMRTTATFLNEQGGRSSYYLVELIRFTDGTLDAFEGRTVLGPRPTRGSSTAAATLDRESFLDSEPDAARRERLADLFDLFEGLRFVLAWGTTGMSIRFPSPDREEPLSIAWVHPSGVSGWMGLSGLAIGYDTGSAANHPSLTPALASYRDALAALPGASPAKAKNLEAWVFNDAAEAANMSNIREVVATLASATTGND